MAGVPYVGAPEIKARWTVLAVRYHSEIGNPGLIVSEYALARGFPLSMQKMRESGCAVRGAARIAAARRWRRMRRCTSSSPCLEGGRAPRR